MLFEGRKMAITSSNLLIVTNDLEEKAFVRALAD